jgi:hypothetical protein
MADTVWLVISCFCVGYTLTDVIRKLKSWLRHG